MPSYLSPGVYVEEVDRGSKPIEAVGTAVAAFVGFTERASDVKDGETRSLLGKPTLVTNWSQYVAKFGGFVKGAYTPDSVYGYFANGGGICYVVSLKTLGEALDPESGTQASVEVPGDDSEKKLITFTAKEAGPRGNNITVEVTPSIPEAPPEGEKGSKAVAPVLFDISVKMESEVVERYEGLSTGRGDNNVQTVLKTQSKILEATVSSANKEVAPSPGNYTLVGGKVETKAITPADYKGDATARVGLGGLEPLEDVTMICAPDLMAGLQSGELDLKAVQGVQQSIINYCELARYCFAILDMPPGLTPQQAKEWRNTVNYDTTRAAMYYPWIEVTDMTGGNGRTRTIPPSGYVAGVYARTDGTRGVHKAPANEIVRGVLSLDVTVTKGEHDLLNPVGVNVIRSFPGRGIRIWGARTLSSDPAWRYINVRRLFSMIEESIERGTQWVVFEPNDQFLWGRVRRDVSAFLRNVWRTGALFGATPEEAFYVKCDAELNPPEVRDLGQLIVEIGIAPTKPAEFVIFRISQWSPGSE